MGKQKDLQLQNSHGSSRLMAEPRPKSPMGT
jgi:hypothetical protein